MNRPLFREEALSRSGRGQHLDQMLRVTAPHMWLVLAALGVALTSLVAWGLLGRVDRTVAVSCHLLQPGQRYEVAAAAGGVVTSLLADVGSPVMQDSPLAVLQSPDLDRQVRIARAQLDGMAAVAASDAAAVSAADLVVAERTLRELQAQQSAGLSIVSPFEGVVSAQMLAVGRSVAVGDLVAEVRAGGDDRLEAVAFLTPDEADDIESGMDATVVVSAAGGDSQALRARVSAVSRQRRASKQQASAASGIPASIEHMVRMELLSLSPAGLADGDPCVTRIVVGRQAPVALLGSVADRA